MAPQIIRRCHALAALALQFKNTQQPAVAAGNGRPFLSASTTLPAGAEVSPPTAGAVDLDRLACQHHGRTGPGHQAPHLIVQLLRRREKSIGERLLSSMGA